MNLSMVRHFAPKKPMINFCEAIACPYITDGGCDRYLMPFASCHLVDHLTGIAKMSPDQTHWVASEDTPLDDWKEVNDAAITHQRETLDEQGKIASPYVDFTGRHSIG